IINTTRPLITGLAGFDNDVFILVDRELVAVVKAKNHSSGTGDFYYYIEESLTRGNHSIVVRARDGDGVVSPESEPHTFFIEPDYPAPTIVKSYVTDGSNPAIVLFGLALNDANIRVYVGDKMVDTFLVDNHSSGTANFQVIIAGLDPGVYDIRLDAAEFSGKVSAKTDPLAAVITQSDNQIVQYDPEGEDVRIESVYEVSRGDSLWSIAQQFYCDGNKWNHIQYANQETYISLEENPSIIEPRWRLKIPSL
ncbi:LysM peptidoglycan-binding domain-containing protein, partial [Patescibacteria group bacterium]|nr:LysM peptidoglycan-binding domain-containing protein [Patescibacteria group bacterium]